MSWHFSRALVEESLEACFSDGDVSVLSKLTSTPEMYSSHGKTTDHLTHSRYGTTSQRLTDDLGEALLMWCQADSRARTFPQQEKAQESKANDQGSGWKWRESYVKYDPDTRLWKTRQCSLLEDSEWFSETWPRWGLMRDGESWELPMSARPIFESASGLWPTIRSSDADRGGRGDRNRVDRLKAIGNGQVPQCAAKAWRILTRDI